MALMSNAPKRVAPSARAGALHVSLEEPHGISERCRQSAFLRSTCSLVIPSHPASCGPGGLLLGGSPVRPLLCLPVRALCPLALPSSLPPLPLHGLPVLLSRLNPPTHESYVLPTSPSSLLVLSVSSLSLFVLPPRDITCSPNRIFSSWGKNGGSLPLYRQTRVAWNSLPCHSRGPVSRSHLPRVQVPKGSLWLLVFLQQQSFHHIPDAIVRLVLSVELQKHLEHSL